MSIQPNFTRGVSDFITIATYDNYFSANFDLQKLQGNDLICYLADEHTVTMKWTLSQAMGGISLRILEEDIEKAKAILAERPESVEVDYKVESEDNLICPRCGSNNAASENYSMRAIGLSWLLLGFPLPFKIFRKNKCFYCDHVWE
jgi:hypothetical protein